MDNASKPTPFLRLKVSIEDSRIVEVKTACGRVIGHVNNGGTGGPNLLVAGTTPEVRLAFERIMLLPIMSSLNGKLILLCLDQLDDAETQTALESVARCVRPIDGTLFLEAQPDSGAVAETVLNFCEKHFMMGSVPPKESPVFRDYAS